MTDKVQPLPDASERQRAAGEFDTNLVVLAGAGTGKTSLLVERLLTAVGSGRVEITQIAAITFTEKAAGEMRQRLAEGLETLRGLARGEHAEDTDSDADRAFQRLLGEPDADAPRIARNALVALEQLDRATVLTIHAFCAELLRRYPLQAGVEPGFTVDTGENEERLAEPAWDEFITRELGLKAPRPALWQRLLADFEVEDLRNVALGLAGFHVPAQLLEPPFVAPSSALLFSAKAGALLERVDDLLKRAHGMTPRTTAFFVEAGRALRALIDQGLEEFKSCVAAADELASRVEGKNSPKANKKLEGVAADQLERLAKQTLRFVRQLTLTDDDAVLQLLEAMAPFARGFRERLLAHGFVTFDALLALARDLLRDHPEVRRDLKRRYKMLLVDEFQDTDPLQYEIVLFLAEPEDESAVDPYSTPLEGGRLFIVGDAKQSVYRFRGADFAAYRAAIDRVSQTGGQQLKLTGNFRSVPGLLESVNRLFNSGDGDWRASDYQPEYVPIEAVRSLDVRGPNVEVWTVELPADAAADQRREAEGRVLAQEIERLVEERAHGYKEISILLRAFTQLPRYVRPLRERGIPFIVDGGKEFMKRPEVAQLLAVLRTLSQPADQAALLAFLRSPAGGVPDTELAEFAASEGCWNWRTEVDESRFGSIADRFQTLRNLAREISDLPADAAVRRVVEATLLLPLNAVAFEGAQRVANLRKLAAVAGELARDGKLSLEEVVDALGEGRLSDFEADSPLADDAADAVRISTIHKMKGLENRVVFLPDLARQDHAGRRERVVISVARLPDGGRALALKAGDVANSTSVWKEEEDRNHEEAEEVRVLYVAMTRARQRLVVIAGPSRRPSRSIDALRAWGYSVDHPPADGAKLADGLVLHRLVRPEASVRAAPDELPASVEPAVEAYTSAVDSMKAAAMPLFRAPSGLSDEGETGLRPHERESALRPVDGGRDLGKAVGLLLHRWLEQWDGQEGHELRDTFRALARSVAAATGVDVRALELEGHEIRDSFLGGPLAHRFRAVHHVGRELPILLRDADCAIYRGSIDLVYTDEAGDLVVADFKTDRQTDEAALRERYREQLRVYATAVQHASDLLFLPRAELWSLRTGQLIRIDWTTDPEPGKLF
jgi:ATP-dependent helicase/nuclease subunit A